MSVLPFADTAPASRLLRRVGLADVDDDDRDDLALGDGVPKAEAHEPVGLDTHPRWMWCDLPRASWRGCVPTAGHQPPATGPSAARAARNAQRATARTRAARRKAEGLCTKCGRPAKPGYTSCADCLRKRNDYRARRHAEGLCSCGEPPLPGLKQCAKCRQRNQERKRRQKAEGRCAHCPRKARPGRRTCARCGDRLRMRAKGVYHRARAERERRAANTAGAEPATQARDPHHRRGPVAGDGA